MDAEMKMMFNTVIDEMGRMEERFDLVDRRFDKMENQLKRGLKALR